MFLELFVAAALNASPVGAGPVEVRVEGVRAGAGTVYVSLCREAEFVDPVHCPFRAKSPASGPAVTLRFADVPPGRYGISAFEDENANGRLDFSFSGRPSEPFGFSRDASAAIGAPHFADVAVEVSAATRLTIHLKP